MTQDELAQLIEQHDIRGKIAYCYQCGTCVGACPVAAVEESYNPRRILEALTSGHTEGLFSSDLVWLCAYCHSCLEKCPQAINVSEILMDLKNIAAKKGKVPKDIVQRAVEVSASGRGVAASKATDRWREKLQLPRLPPLNKNEVRQIMTLTGFAKLLEQTQERTEGKNG